jgi:hypothetical protein
LISVVGYIWIAVGWHRFILLGEAPGRVLPRWNGFENWIYFLKVLLLSVIMIAIVILPQLILIYFGFGLFLIGLEQTIVSVLGLYVFYRLSLTLPAAAVGISLGLRESWQTTREVSWAIWFVPIVFALLTIVEYLVVQKGLFNSVSIGLIFLISGVLKWITLMFGISVLTTLYGYLVEGREMS